MKSKFVNGNRTKEQRRVIYCYLRQIGFSRKEARIVEGWRKLRIIEGIKEHFEGKSYYDTEIEDNT